ncbi:MAG: twin-arginine translocase TatA/TatE family subunit [Thermoleophilia bacterium]|nr:twin-arginine translocase TatA/TatE family subunit [Thermoleophilia bacterium]
MPGFIGPTELIVFGIIALLLLGPKKLPEMGRSLGKGMREFKESVSGDTKHDEQDVTKFETAAPETLVAEPVSSIPVATAAASTPGATTAVADADLESAR